MPSFEFDSKEGGLMLTIERVKEILNRSDLTDEQLEDIRDSFKRLAEIVFEKWQKDQTKLATNHKQTNGTT